MTGDRRGFKARTSPAASTHRRKRLTMQVLQSILFIAVALVSADRAGNSYAQTDDPSTCALGTMEIHEIRKLNDLKHDARFYHRRDGVCVFVRSVRRVFCGAQASVLPARFVCVGRSLDTEGRPDEPEIGERPAELETVGQPDEPEIDERPAEPRLVVENVSLGFENWTVVGEVKGAILIGPDVEENAASDEQPPAEILGGAPSAPPARPAPSDPSTANSVDSGGSGAGVEKTRRLWLVGDGGCRLEVTAYVGDAPLPSSSNGRVYLCGGGGCGAFPPKDYAEDVPAWTF